VHCVYDVLTQFQNLQARHRGKDLIPEDTETSALHLQGGEVPHGPQALLADVIGGTVPDDQCPETGR